MYHMMQGVKGIGLRRLRPAVSGPQGTSPNLNHPDVAQITADSHISSVTVEHTSMTFCTLPSLHSHEAGSSTHPCRHFPVAFSIQVSHRSPPQSKGQLHLHDCGSSVPPFRQLSFVRLQTSQKSPLHGTGQSALPFARQVHVSLFKILPCLQSRSVLMQWSQRPFLPMAQPC